MSFKEKGWGLAQVVLIDCSLPDVQAFIVD
jgi:hypothetical protein